MAWITEKSHTHIREFIKGCSTTNEAETPSSSDERSIDGNSGDSGNIQRGCDKSSTSRFGATAGATSHANGYSTTDEAGTPSSSHGRNIDGTSEDSSNILRGCDSHTDGRMEMHSPVPILARAAFW